MSRLILDLKQSGIALFGEIYNTYNVHTLISNGFLFLLNRSLNTSSVPIVSGSVKNIGRGSIIENNNKVLDNVQASLSSWGNQQVCKTIMFSIANFYCILGFSF